MVGFKHKITFNNNGKITDYQKSYNDNYSKIVEVFLPLNFNNKKKYKIRLSASINNTFPKRIEEVEGIKSDTDLNKYTFDVSNLFLLTKNSKLGLCKIRLINDSNRIKFESESFRI